MTTFHSSSLSSSFYWFVKSTNGKYKLNATVELIDKARQTLKLTVTVNKMLNNELYTMLA